jgi:coenzyme F420-dependent glucose-6-phosphate dehydrogenase
MARIGIHASHEILPPSTLLRLVQDAQNAGFGAAMASDHFHPWTPAQGQSGFAWSWLGASLQATEFSNGVVCAPGQRYHPAIIAQASATLEEMFPGRFWLAIGSGQALNERITGLPWPDKAIRDARLEECAVVIRALWSGEIVSHRGLVNVERARLYTLPERPPPLLGAALTPQTASRVARWADGLITAGKEHEDLKRVVEAFRDAGGGNKPVFLQSAIAYADSEDAAARSALRQWPVCALGPEELEDTESPELFEELTERVGLDIIRRKIRISSDTSQHASWIAQDIELGFEAIYLHHLGPDMDRFIHDFAARVLPEVSGN